MYRSFPTKDDLVGACLGRLKATILGAIDTDIDAHLGEPAGAILAIFDAVRDDLGRPNFRGCAFNSQFWWEPHARGDRGRAEAEELSSPTSWCDFRPDQPAREQCTA